jgi:hypothetical protein
MRIELDKPGQPHWLSKRVLRVIVGKARQLRLRIRDRPRHLRIVK